MRTASLVTSSLAAIALSITSLPAHALDTGSHAYKSFFDKFHRHIDERLPALRKVLQPTVEQMPQWDAYETQMRALIAKRREITRAAIKRGLSHETMQAQLRTLHNQTNEQHLATRKSLIAVLTREQRENMRAHYKAEYDKFQRSKQPANANDG